MKYPPFVDAARTRRTGRRDLRRSIGSIGRGGLSALLIAGAMSVGLATFETASPVAAANPITCDGTELVSAYGSTVTRINTSTFASEVLIDDTDVPGMAGTNQVAVSNGGGTVFATTIVQDSAGVDQSLTLVHDVVADTTEVLPNPPGGGVAGSVDLSRNLFYYGNHGQTVSGPNDSQDRAAVYNVYDPATKQTTAGVATIRLSALDSDGNPFFDADGNQIVPGGAGDVAFDLAGNMYILANTTANMFLYKVPGPISATPNTSVIEPEILYVGPTPSGAFVGGLAFDADGTMYLGSAGVLYEFDIKAGTNSAVASFLTNDLASCMTPPRVRAQKNVPAESGRQTDTDQFTISLTGSLRDESVTTEGTDTGVQAQVIEPVLAQWGNEYTIAETPAGTTDPALYDTTWECFDEANNTMVATGTGTTGTFTMPPVVGAMVVCTFTNTARKDEVAVTKSANPDSGTEVVPGQDVEYTLTFDNSANSAPAPVNYVDDVTGVLDNATLAAGPSAIGEGIAISEITDGQLTITGELAPGAIATVTYTVTVNDPPAENFELLNVLFKNGTTPPDECVDGDALCTVHPVATDPAIEIVKSATVTDVDDSGTNTVGDTVAYTFAVTNVGDVPLSDVTVTDPLLGDGPMTCPQQTLAVGEKIICEGASEHTLTEEDITNGVVRNTATVVGTDPTGTDVTDADTVEVPTKGIPAIEIKKTATVTDVDDSGTNTVGDTVAYTFNVTNTGTTPLTGIAVTDALLGDEPMTCPQEDLAVGESMVCEGTAEYTLTEADLDEGTRENTAAVTATSPDGIAVDDNDTVEVVVVGVPMIEIIKMATVNDRDRSGTNTVGDTVQYTFGVTNTGTSQLTDIVVTDDRISNGPMDCPKDELEPQEEMICKAPALYTITAADLQAGEVVNVGKVEGVDPDDTEVVDDDTNRLPVVPLPSTPQTGSDAVGTMLSLGFLAILGGAALTTVARRRRAII